MELALHLIKWNHATTTELLRADTIPDDAVERAIRKRKLLRVRRGAFAVPAEHELWRARSGVAVARTRPGTVLSHASALAALGLPVLRNSPYSVELMSSSAKRIEVRPGKLCLRPGADAAAPLADWPDVEAVLPGIAIAQVSTKSLLAGVVAADAALRMELLTPAELADQCEQCRPARGRATVARTVELADGRSESPGESRLRLCLLFLGIHTVPQVSFFDDRGFIGRVDLHDPDNDTVYEFDGLEKYSGAKGHDALIAEKLREDRLRALGLRVVRVVWADFEPNRLAALVRGADQLAA